MPASRARRGVAGTTFPVATYRVQLTPWFGFAKAAAILPYLASLGIGDLYTSPILASRAGSEHGYDVVDPTRLDRDLGGARGFERLRAALRARGMGLLVDVVPNHMAVGAENPWWNALLREGGAGEAGRIFDLDLAQGDRILLPVLAEDYVDALASGALRLARDGRGRYVIRYDDLTFPLAPRSLRLIRERGAAAEALAAFARDPALLDRLLEQQHYRLAHWRTANRELNYRRFFDISDLAAVRMEDRAVFDRMHRLLLDLVAEGTVTGLRIDHVDGLWDPLTYLRWLRQEGVPWVVVEKILAPDESLPRAWPVRGTTGYEALNLINQLFVDPEGLTALGEAYAHRVGPARFEAVLLDAKRMALRELLAAEVDRVVRRLQRARPPVDEHALRHAVIEVTARLRVYRTYGRGTVLSQEDRRRIDQAVREAEGVDPATRSFVGRALSRRIEATVEAADRWQQLSGPAMAKGFEDTALYRYNRLVSCNEVGGVPEPGWVDVARFHRAMQARSAGGLTATATHDTKRGEDTRARIDVLSELPEVFAEAAARWRRLTDRHRPALGVPDPDEEWLLYQTLLGVWPLHARDRADLAKRAGDYMIKAAREAKRRTSWLDPDVEHEESLRAFVEAILADERFVADVRPIAERVARHGALNSLAQTLLKVCVPGVPDVYQGAELWDLSLVDPDNRRPVDYRARTRLLRALDRAEGRDRDALLAELRETWVDGRIKLFVLSRALRARAAHRRTFERGSYVPLRARGRHAQRVIAFARRRDRAWVVCAVPRLTVALDPVEGDWAGTTVRLPAEAPRAFEDVFSGGAVRASRGGLPVAALFERFPVALLVPAVRSPR